MLAMLDANAAINSAQTNWAPRAIEQAERNREEQQPVAGVDEHGMTPGYSAVFAAQP